VYKTLQFNLEQTRRLIWSQWSAQECTRRPQKSKYTQVYSPQCLRICPCAWRRSHLGRSRILLG